MAGLFSPGKIGALELKNRMIRTASHEGLADRTGAPTEQQFEFYRKFVEGGIGLVITGYAGVMQNGKSALYRMTMIDSDDQAAGHKAMVDRIHQQGGRIVLQLAHCGSQTLSSATGEPMLVAPSPVPNRFYKERPRELTNQEIFQVIGSFARAAARARDAGYDGVQVHAAHGYLLSTFLSRHSNRRKDRWGGSLENRFRIVGETLRAVKQAAGREYPVLIKLNCFETAVDGMKPDECVRIARMVEDTGCCDAIEISAGSNEDGFYMARGAFPAEAILKYLRPYSKMNAISRFFMRRLVTPLKSLSQPPFREGYNLDAAALVKKAVSLPLITVGGMRSKGFMEAAIQEGRTDFVSLARPLLREPDLAAKFQRGESEAAKCDNCNICFVAADTVPIQCHQGEFA
jgi:2,4-dienoyl-CoA reductase-like NADH-dependent reductase (Old Yellow Enzyme family)